LRANYSEGHLPLNKPGCQQTEILNWRLQANAHFQNPLLETRVGDLSSGQNHFGDMRACGANPLLSLTTSAVTDPPWLGTDKKQKAGVANFGALGTLQNAYRTCHYLRRYSNRWSATRMAFAMMVNEGFTALAETKQEASTT
jgi:hypothetical protein